MATVFECNWENGSGILNTGATYAWNSETDSGNKLSEATNSAMWGSHYLYWNGQSSAAGYLAETFVSNYGSSGYRFGLNCFSEGLSAGQQQTIMRIADTSLNPLFDMYLYDNGTYLLLYFQVYDTGGTGRNTSAKVLSTGTNYQIICKLQKNTAGGFYYKVYQEDGTTQVGSEIQLSTDYTTRNTNAYAMFTGTIFANGVTTEHGFDIIQAIDSYTYPYTIEEDITLTVAELTHSHSLDAFALTQVHNLTVSELLHSHSLDAIVTTRAGRACLAFTAKSTAYNFTARSLAYNFTAKDETYNFTARSH